MSPSRLNACAGGTHVRTSFRRCSTSRFMRMMYHLSCFGKCRRKRSTAGEAESKGQSSASCTVYCPARRSSTTQKGARIPRRVYVRTYVRPRTYTFVRPHMRSHEQHPQTRSGSPHNACISLVHYCYKASGKSYKMACKLTGRLVTVLVGSY